MMRPLVFDFPQDEKAAGIMDAYMFGPNLLICPITESMEGEESVRTVYLPAGTDWYDFYTEERYEGCLLYTSFYHHGSNGAFDEHYSAAADVRFPQQLPVPRAEPASGMAASSGSAGRHADHLCAFLYLLHAQGNQSQIVSKNKEVTFKSGNRALSGSC